MTDEKPTESTQTGDPDQDGVTPEKVVTTQIDEAVEAEYRTLDDLPEAARKVAEEYARSQQSKAVNEALAKKKADGIPMTKEDVQSLLKSERDLADAKSAARDQLHLTLAKEHKILPHSEEYEKFAAALQSFRSDAIRTPEGIALVVRAAGLDAPAETPTGSDRGVQSLYPPRSSDGNAVNIPEGGVPLNALNKAE